MTLATRFSRMALAALATLAIAATAALAAAPVPGTYLSTDLGGLVLLGRGSQSWVAPLNANQGMGDVFNSASWNGAALGTQWTFGCGVQPSQQTTTDNRVGGTGTVVFNNTFIGGNFFLSRFGPWGDGVNDLTGTVNLTQADVTLQYVNIGGVSTPVGSRLNLNSSGQFNGSSCILTYTIANGIGLGDTDLAPFPPNYPALIDPNCTPTRSNGSWGDVKDIAMLIECPVPARGTTWGAVKQLYR